MDNLHLGELIRVVAGAAMRSGDLNVPASPTSPQVSFREKLINEYNESPQLYFERNM